jgi:hypothetical protein
MSPLRSANLGYYVKVLLGGAAGLIIATSIMYLAYGPKGFLYLVGGLIAYSCGLLFLKVFRPGRDV